MLLSVFLPLFNFLLIALFGRFMGKAGVIYITLYSMLLVTILNLKLFYLSLTLNTTFYILLGSWINLAFLNVNWEFMLDPLAVSMLAMVSVVSTLVHIYSFAYMKTDPHFNRFISFLSLFTFFMFILVTASNFIQLFLGWEGVGICSYLLINFWFTRIQANKAAIKALIMNRVGDIGYLIGVVLVFWLFRTVDFTLLSQLAPTYSLMIPVLGEVESLEFMLYDAICFFLLIGVVGKSAQLGLHTWLPAAIEGPTPVSALIHAATMVTAGIFLLIRVSFLFEYSSAIRALIIILGAITALVSAFTAIFLYDIKRIIAYSTCSQLGYMALACGLSQYNIGLFHLINHAFFKALLFLTAGAIIHSFNNEQDIRKLSGLFTRMPFIFSAILIGNVAIMGLPFLSGFYSKDLIIEITYLKANGVLSDLFGVNSIFIIILMATLCTGVYSIRMFYFLFIRQTSVHKQNFFPGNSVQPVFIQIALFVLMLGSIFSGYLLSDLFQPTNNYFRNHLAAVSENMGDAYDIDKLYSEFDYATIFESNLELSSYPNYQGEHHFFYENEFLPWYIKLAPLFCNLFSIFGGMLFMYHYQNKNIPQINEILLAFISESKLNAFYKNYKAANVYLYFMRNLNTRFGVVVKAAQNNFYFNEVYNYISFVNYHYYYKGVFLNIDKGILELIGPTGLGRLYLYITKNVSYFYQQNLIKHIFSVYVVILVYLVIMELFF